MCFAGDDPRYARGMVDAEPTNLSGSAFRNSRPNVKMGLTTCSISSPRLSRVFPVVTTSDEARRKPFTSVFLSKPGWTRIILSDRYTPALAMNPPTGDRKPRTRTWTRTGGFEADTNDDDDDDDTEAAPCWLVANSSGGTAFPQPV